MRKKGQDNSRQALIDAAGMLIVEKGDSRVVTTREIIARAHITGKSTIDYHFGNKAGLLKAVFGELRQAYVNSTLAAYLKKHEDLLNTREGCIEFVKGMIDDCRNNHKRIKKHPWHWALSCRLAQNEEALVDYDMAEIYFEGTTAFYEIFRRITGRTDVNEAYMWFMSTIAVMTVRTFRLRQITRMGKELELNPDYDDQFAEFAKSQLLEGWGLMTSRNKPGGILPQIQRSLK